MSDYSVWRDYRNRVVAAGLADLGGRAYRSFFRRGGKVYTSTSDQTVEVGTMDQSEGMRRRTVRTAYGGRKRFSAMKLLKSSFNYTEQQLGVRSADDLSWLRKHPVSEFNPNSGGHTCIDQNSSKNYTPMHCYDLNYFIGSTEDNQTNWPLNASWLNTDINARHWVWRNDCLWEGVRDRRWYINEPRTINQDTNPGVKVYRNGLDIKYIVYGTRLMPTEYDIRVIKITDMKMCPDFDWSGQNPADETREIQQNWSNLVRAWTINPILRGVEPGPEPVKRWFTTIAKKRIRVGEATSDVNSIPCVEGRLRVKINEAQNYAWTNKDFNLETGDVVYDAPPNVEDNAENNAFMHKPYYTSRYYLLIRALCPVDCVAVGQDNAGTVEAADYFNNPTGGGTDVNNYSPTYDLIIRQKFMTINAN